MTIDLNILAAWVGFLLGVLSGIVPGMAFHREEWLGGYDSWPRRLIRLGHIAFFGIGLLNLAFAVTARYLAWSHPPAVASAAMAAAVLLMPAVCFLSAWKPGFRHLFFIPVSCVLAGIVGVLIGRAGS